VGQVNRVPLSYATVRLPAMSENSMRMSQEDGVTGLARTNYPNQIRSERLTNGLAHILRSGPRSFIAAHLESQPSSMEKVRQLG